MVQTATWPKYCLPIKLHWNLSFLDNRANDVTATCPRYCVTHQNPLESVFSQQQDEWCEQLLAQVTVSPIKIHWNPSFLSNRTNDANSHLPKLLCHPSKSTGISLFSATGPIMQTATKLLCHPSKATGISLFSATGPMMQTATKLLCHPSKATTTSLFILCRRTNGGNRSVLLRLPKAAGTSALIHCPQDLWWKQFLFHWQPRRPKTARNGVFYVTGPTVTGPFSLTASPTKGLDQEPVSFSAAGPTVETVA